MIRAPKASQRHDSISHRAAEVQATQQSTDRGVSIDAPGGSGTGRTLSRSERLCRSFGLTGRAGRETRELANVG